MVNMQGFESSIDLDLLFGIFAAFVLPLYYFLGALGDLLGLRRLPTDESRSTVNMQGSAPGLPTNSPRDHFWNFYNLLYYFLGALGAPGDPPGWGKSAVFAPSTPRLSAEQIDCIFTMDYGCRGPPTP